MGVAGVVFNLHPPPHKQKQISFGQLEGKNGLLPSLLADEVLEVGVGATCQQQDLNPSSHSSTPWRSCNPSSGLKTGLSQLYQEQLRELLLRYSPSNPYVGLTISRVNHPPQLQLIGVESRRASLLSSHLRSCFYDQEAVSYLYLSLPSVAS